MSSRIQPEAGVPGFSAVGWTALLAPAGTPKAFIGKLTEEHAQVDVSRCRTRPRVGERVTVIPNHICPVVNLHDSAWWWEADGSLQVLPVDARGKLS